MFEWIKLPEGSIHEHRLNGDLARLSVGQAMFICRATEEWRVSGFLPNEHRCLGLKLERGDGEVERYLVGATWVLDHEAGSRIWPFRYLFDKLFGARLLLVTLWFLPVGILLPKPEIIRVIPGGEDPFESVLEAVHQRLAGYRLLSRSRYKRTWTGRAA